MIIDAWNVKIRICCITIHLCYTKHKFYHNAKDTTFITINIILLFKMQPPDSRGETGRALAMHILGPGFKSRSGKTFLAFFGVLKYGDLEYDNRFMVAHIALRVKVFSG